MKRPLVCVVLLIGICGCTSSPEVGQRFRAEREIWKANAEFRQLSIRPELVSDVEWDVMAHRYESIAARHATLNDGSAPLTQAARDLRLITARALMNAAQIHSIRADTLHMLELLTRVETEYADLPKVSSDVFFAQGRVAESRGDLRLATDRFERVLDRVEPAPGEPGVPGAVHGLPLHIARMMVKADSTRAEAAYAQAATRYQSWISKFPGTLIEFDSHVRLADIAADQGRLQDAAAHLHRLESRLAAMDTPPRDPAGVRYAIALVHSRSEATSDSARTTLEALVARYPRSPFAPRALLVLAQQADSRQAVDEALEHLNRVRANYPGDQKSNAQAMLARARVLEKHGRWREALDEYRTLAVEQPFSAEALAAPLAIADHYAQTGDEEEAKDRALREAERNYSDFIERNTPGPLTMLARRNLAATLARQGRFQEAVAGLVELSELTAGSRQGAQFLIDAAQLANSTGDSTTARKLVDQFKTLYGSKTNRRAVDESDQLQGATSP